MQTATRQHALPDHPRSAAFGPGYSTPAARAWVNGGSPTKGYLSSSTGPLAGFFQALPATP